VRTARGGGAWPKAVEEWNRGMHGHDASGIAAAERRRFGAGHDFRFGNPAATCRTLGEADCFDLAPQRDQFAARRFSLFEQTLDRRQWRG
jgi:hypothetical protein